MPIIFDIYTRYQSRLKMMYKIFLVLTLSYSLQLLAQDSTSIGNYRVYTTSWEKIVPHDNLPEEVKPLKSNNNIDLINYQGRFYFALRTAPSHFPDKKTYCYILSTLDFQEWKYEKTFYLGADIREPRFVVLNDTLFFYFFEGGKVPTTFEPKHIWGCYSNGNGDWSSLTNIGLDGYVPWRLRERDGIIYLSAYYGVDLYRDKHEANLRLFESEDGLNFTPISTNPQVTTKGAEEGEFEFDAEGNLWGTVRLEGSGAYLVYADKDSLSVWNQWFTKYKYDSALLLNHEDEFFLIARRNLAGEATQFEYPNKKQRNRNLMYYSLTPKTTALYYINKDTKEIEHLMDFPSTGDTAFPAIAKIDDNSYYLLNYSSDIGGKPKKWIRGQLEPTYIYKTILRFEPK